MIKSFKDTNNNSTTNPKKIKEEVSEEFSLRPQNFKDFIGQKTEGES